MKNVMKVVLASMFLLFVIPVLCFASEAKCQSGSPAKSTCAVTDVKKDIQTKSIQPRKVVKEKETKRPAFFKFAAKDASKITAVKEVKKAQPKQNIQPRKKEGKEIVKKAAPKVEPKPAEIKKGLVTEAKK